MTVSDSVSTKPPAATDELERKVQERTAELVLANAALQKQIAAHLHAEEMKSSLAAILEVTNDLVAMAENNGKLIYLNRAGRRMLGVGEEEAVSQLHLPSFHPAWILDLITKEGIPTAIRKGLWSGETALLSRSGREIPVLQTILAHYDKHGVLEFLSTIARDITERKRAEEERQDLLKEYRMMFDSVPALIWYKDRDNRILRVNRPAAASMGKSVTELEGKSTYDLYPDEAEKYHQDDLEVIRAEKPKLGIIEQVVKQGGEKIWVRTDKVPYRNERGEIIGVIVFAVDVTDRQLAQEEINKLNAELEQRVMERTAQLEEANRQLIEAERIKSEFFANVSHELRTPLTLALAPLESLLSGEGGPLAQEQSAVLKTVYNNVVRLLQMVTGLLDFSRFEAGKIEVHPEPVEIVALTQAILADFTPLMLQKELKPAFHSETPQTVVALDRYLYERILFNLLANAVKFTLPGGSVSVELDLHGDRLQLSVRDTGIGIAAADIQHLFKKFRQLEGSATRRFEGTGLGLALVKEFAELLQGAISVKSKEGVGSTFTLECLAPRVPMPQAPPPPRQRKIRQFKADPVPAQETVSSAAEGLDPRAKIVIAEDNLELATYIVSLLRESYQTRVARDGEEALALVREWSPHLVLSDVMMPKRDGLSLCREIKADPATLKIPVVLLTAMTHREALMKGWEAGADEYLFKPFHPRELLTRLRTILTAVQERQRVEDQLHRKAEELTRSNRELEMFAYVASHDLQEPLRMVASYMELLKQRYQDHLDEKANRWIGFAVDGVIRMKMLINDLLEYSRVVTRGNVFKTTDGNSVFKAVLQNLQQAIQESNALVSSGPLPTLLADTTQFTEVLQNLIGNALKYRSPQRAPEVHVEAKRQGEQWLFSVRDNGIGIEPQFYERIFVIFQRLHTREEYPGTGIGLTLCQKIVERHGGRIWLESQPGQGTTFFFTIADQGRDPYESVQTATTHP